MKKILLVEPSYRNKYPPLGLMKISSYHRACNDEVRFVKGDDPAIFFEVWDRVYVTTLFSFEWKRTSQAIDFAIKAANNQPERVFVGGISASLMNDQFVNESRWAGVRFIAGLLDKSPAQSLQLSSDNGDFGVEDLLGQPIEERVPDYNILNDIDYTYPVNDAYFGYASRGCIRKCHFCGVPKLEGAQREMPPLYNLVNGVSKEFGEKKDLVLMDNNVTASARYKEVIAEICDLGFTKGAKLERNGKRVKRRVDFNQGVDARILAKSHMFLEEMAKICISPLRIAFDHIGLKKPYEKAIHMAADNGITSLSNYMLYNFKDTPEDLYERMRLNISLNEELGIRIWSFPMRYQPVTLKDRSHIGDNWNKYYLRSFQVILQATRGVVSGSPDFFKIAFGENKEAFKQLLTQPHGFIFNREYYTSGEGKAVRDEYMAIRNRLSTNQENTLLEYLRTPIGGEKTQQKYYASILNKKGIEQNIKNVLAFHQLGTKEGKISASEKIIPMFQATNPDIVFPNEEEFVEDAGLYDHEQAAQDASELVKSTGTV